MWFLINTRGETLCFIRMKSKLYIDQIVYRQNLVIRQYQLFIYRNYHLYTHIKNHNWIHCFSFYISYTVFNHYSTSGSFCCYIRQNLLVHFCINNYCGWLYFRGLNKNDTFVGLNIRGHNIFLLSSCLNSLFRCYWNSWIGHSTKTTKIGTPRKLSHPQYNGMMSAPNMKLFVYIGKGIFSKQRLKILPCRYLLIYLMSRLRSLNLIYKLIDLPIRNDKEGKKNFNLPALTSSTC